MAHKAQLAPMKEQRYCRADGHQVGQPKQWTVIPFTHCRTQNLNAQRS
jgi:hypothetical protein